MKDQADKDTNTCSIEKTGFTPPSVSSPTLFWQYWYHDWVTSANNMISSVSIKNNVPYVLETQCGNFYEKMLGKNSMHINNISVKTMITKSPVFLWD